jgi:hypothetical protein
MFFIISIAIIARTFVIKFSFLFGSFLVSFCNAHFPIRSLNTNERSHHNGGRYAVSTTTIINVFRLILSRFLSRLLSVSPILHGCAHTVRDSLLSCLISFCHHCPCCLLWWCNFLFFFVFFSASCSLCMCVSFLYFSVNIHTCV